MGRVASCVFALVAISCSGKQGPSQSPDLDPEASGDSDRGGGGGGSGSTPVVYTFDGGMEVTPQSFRSRAEAAAAFATIKPGMSADDVRAKLGTPDDIRTEKDPGGIATTDTAEIWRYGTSGHLTFATLGAVYIKADRTVQYVFGGSGNPPTGFEESELRRLLALVNAVPSYNATFEPQRLIEAVNALEKLQKGRALAVIDEYLRVSSPFHDGGREGVFLLVRALFEPPKGAPFPPMRVGEPDLDPPSDPKLLPHFPLVIVDDLPLMLVSGFLLGGKAQDPADDVLWFRHNGTMRLRPMRPPDDPLGVATTYIDRRLTKIVAVDEALRVRLYDQLMRLVSTVHRPPSTHTGFFPAGRDVAKRWEKVRAEVKAQGPRWDVDRARYTRKDGSIVEAPVTAYQRVWWDMNVPGTSLSRITFERVSDMQVKVLMRFDLQMNTTIDPGTVTIHDGSGKLLNSVPTGEASTAPGATSTWASDWFALIPKGTKVRITFARGAAKLTSNELVP